MEPATSANDDLMSRGRILRREWKRYKPVNFPLYITLHPVVDLAMVCIASAEIYFITTARIGSRAAPSVHLPTVWLLEYAYTVMPLVFLDIF
jgi:hypothetical protein